MNQLPDRAADAAVGVGAIATLTPIEIIQPWALVFSMVAAGLYYLVRTYTTLRDRKKRK